MLSKFSVKRPYTVLVAVVLVLILGGVSFINLQTDLLPDIDLPFLVISTSYTGASPEEIEMVVTRPLEQIVATTSNIKNINSVSSENSSLLILEFNNDVNMDSAIIEINGNVDMIKSHWPDEVSSPMIIRLNPDMLPIMIASIDVEDMDVLEISDLVKDTLLTELESVNGLASVTASGLLQETVEVLLDQDKIDDINDRILKKVDSGLAEAEDQLASAQEELESGLNKLNSEEEKQMAKLLEAEFAMETGMDQLIQAEMGLEAALMELRKNRESLLANKEIFDGNEEVLNRLKQGLEDLEKASEQLSQENRQMLLQLTQSLKDLLAQEGELEEGLILIDEKIIELEGQKKELASKKKELTSGRKELSQGKNKLSTEMTKARIELAQGQAMLEGKMGEFEEAKEEAFKKASLDGVINKEMISGILMGQNFSMPAGYVAEDGVQHLVKLGDKFENVDQMKKLLLFDTGDEGIGKIYLSDIADIVEKDNSDQIYAKVNGNNAVIMSFQKQSNFSTSDVSRDLKIKMAEIEGQYEGLTFSHLMDQGIYIKMVVDSVLNNIIFGGILAILILIVFLKSFRPTLIIAFSIPISIIFAIAMMYFTGVTINIISLAGLALGVGMLVDNSIVVIENIYRLRNEGVPAVRAAVEGAKEVAGAIAASTITTASVFLPIVFTKGLSRQLFTDMGLTISYSLFASLIVALTLVPAMAASLLRRSTFKEAKLLDYFISIYERILGKALKYRWITMGLVFSLLILSIYMALGMGTSFIPDMESPQMSMTLNFDQETGFEDRVNISNHILDLLVDLDGIETIGAFQSVGGPMGMMGGGGGEGPTLFYIIVDQEKNISNVDLEKEILRKTDHLNVELAVNASNMDMSQLAGSGVEVLVKGHDLDRLRDIGLELGEILENIPGTKEISTGVEEGSSEIRITVDKEKAMEHGLTVGQLFLQLSDRLSAAKEATNLTVANRDLPVLVLDGLADDLTPDNLMEMSIKTPNEEEIPLGDIASFEREQGLNSIFRRSQERYLTVSAELEPGYNIGLVSREFEDKLKDYKLEDGYSLEMEGENKLIQDSLRDLFLMLALALAFIYLIMVAQFQSLLSPFIVMFTIPLAFTGGLLALWLTGMEISLIAMLGFLVLSGVVVNNGIVFVDYANQMMLEGRPKREALLLTGKTRMRPILMTAITTILGLSTLAMAMGPGAEMLQPLAIVAIGGLLYATLLTLVVVPVMYDILHGETLKQFEIEEDEHEQEGI